MWHYPVMVIRAITLVALTYSLASLGPPLHAAPFAGPSGFKACAPSDPVVTVESRLAARLGGDFLGCFRSDPVDATNPVPPTSMASEYAFALAIHDREYSTADLHDLLSKVEQQWKGFEPVDGNLSDAYVSKLNGLIDEQRKDGGAGVQSVRPILVKIDHDHSNYYTVTSIRTYVVAANAARITATRVNADAVVLRDSRLLRLTIQRTLTGPADIARAEADIDRWAESIK